MNAALALGDEQVEAAVAPSRLAPLPTHVPLRLLLAATLTNFRLTIVIPAWEGSRRSETGNQPDKARFFPNAHTMHSAFGKSKQPAFKETSLYFLYFCRPQNVRMP
jgi:hypothetical protein